MTERTALLDLVAALGDARVLCVGDVILDHFRYGTIERISPEAPVPVLLVERADTMLGGAGNVVRNLAALGAHVHLVSAAGDDEAGAEVRRRLDADGAVDHALLTDAQRRTSTKTRYLAGNQQVLRADRETVTPLGPQTRKKLLNAVSKALGACDVIVLSDYGKGVLADGVAGEVIARARAAEKPVVVDPKGRDYGPYRGASLLTPNRRELAEATGKPVDTDRDIALAARELIRNHSLGAVLVTRGRDGMTLLTATDKAGRGKHLSAEAREVFDVSGAGDTVVAAVAAALAAGAGLAQGAALANVAAGIVVGKVGTAVADASEVAAALRHQGLSTAEAKVMTLEAALGRLAGWRQKGLRIGFTNGCFDLLHPGHVALLAKARRDCDRLVVGLNSDASVTRLKGRPADPGRGLPRRDVGLPGQRRHGGGVRRGHAPGADRGGAPRRPGQGRRLGPGRRGGGRFGGRLGRPRRPRRNRARLQHSATIARMTK